MKIKIWKVSGYKGDNDYDGPEDNNFELEVAMDARFMQEDVEEFFFNRFSKKYRTVALKAMCAEEKSEMKKCIAKNELRCIYLKKDNYEELLKEDYPDYQSEYTTVTIEDDAVTVDAHDMVHVARTYDFGWWVEEEREYGYSRELIWIHYTDKEFEKSFMMI